MSFRRGRRLALDIGSVRIGVAACDPDGILATPAATVDRRPGDKEALRELQNIANEYEPIEVLVGEPTSLDGTARASAATALDFTHKVAAQLQLPIRLIDERFTTTQAHQQLAAAGKSSRARRHIVDAAAATVILQTGLDTEKRTGQPPGRLLE